MQPINFDALTNEEKAALKVAIVYPHRILKDVLPELLGTTSSYMYKLHEKGKNLAFSKLLLDSDGAPTEKVFKILPQEILIEWFKITSDELRKLAKEHSELNLRLLDKENQIKELSEEVVKLKQELKDRVKIIF
jgi:hypothetical protein